MGGPLHFRVFEHFFQRAAIAAADDGDPLRRRVGKQHRVAHHLVIEEILAAGQHGAAVDEHESAPLLRIVDFDLLKGGPLLVEFAFVLEREGAAALFVGFGNPGIVQGHGGAIRFEGVKEGALCQGREDEISHG